MRFSNCTITCGGVTYASHRGAILETTIPGGFSTASFTILLNNISQVDDTHQAFRYNARVIVTGPNIVLWEGVVRRTEVDTYSNSIRVECVGIWANSRDFYLARRAYADHGYSNWYDAHPLPPGTDSVGGTHYHTNFFMSDKFTVDKYSRLYITQQPQTYVSSEGHNFVYFVDSAFMPKRLSFHVRYNIPVSMTCQCFLIRATTYNSVAVWTQAGAGTETGTDLSYDLTSTTDITHIVFRLYFNQGVTLTDVEGTYYLEVTEPHVDYTGQNPLTAKWVVADIAQNVANNAGFVYSPADIDPTLGTSTVKSLMFDQPVSVPEMFETINASYMNGIMGVWEDSVFKYLAMPGADYVASLSSANVLQDNLKWDFSNVYNHVYVRYADENQRTTYMQVDNADPDNYLNMWSASRFGSIWLSESQSDDEALAAANAFLDNSAYAKPTGSLLLDLHTYSFLRAGMNIMYQGGPYKEQVLMITTSRIDIDKGTIEITLSDEGATTPRTVLRNRRVQRWHKVGFVD